MGADDDAVSAVLPSSFALVAVAVVRCAAIGILAIPLTSLLFAAAAGNAVPSETSNLDQQKFNTRPCQAPEHRRVDLELVGGRKRPHPISNNP